MNILYRTELKLEKYDKCELVCDNDCSLGMIYDYTCAVQSFIVQKMNEAQPEQKESKEQEATVIAEALQEG